MDKKIFLEGFGSKQAVNTSEGLNISLKGKKILLPIGDYSGIVSAYEQYTKERKDCNTIRLTCQINTVCSNVLFNRITEVIKDEGSPNPYYLNYGIANGDIKENDTVGVNVMHKEEKMSFWSGNTIAYIPRVDDISASAAEDDLSDITRDWDRVIGEGDIQEESDESIKHITSAIRDTQLSDKGYVYHCGIDFFNNHLLRSNTFKTICKIDSTNIGKYTAFNTIADIMRDVNGDIVVEKIGFPSDSGIPGNTKTVALHVYTADDIDTFEDTVSKRLIQKYNGWVGFYNKSKIKSYEDFDNSEKLPIDRPIMYMNGGDFVDMYPDHELFSFVPKYNKFRNRIEKNWNYCITYPSSSTTEGFEDIIEQSNNSLKTIYFDENTRSDNGTSQLVMYSRAKHGLKQGDTVNIYKTYETTLYYIQKTVGTEKTRVSDYYEEETEAEDLKKELYGEDTKYTVESVANQTVNHKIIDNAEVADIVDDFIFTVFNAGVQISDGWVEISGTTEGDDGRKYIEIDDEKYYQDPYSPEMFTNENGDKRYYLINGKYMNIDDNAQNITYKKVVGDIECDYYVRIFTRVPNFRFASGDTSTEYEITKKEGTDNKTKIERYSSHEYEFESQVSRLAFAKNIYSDDIGEIVFTDDINIANLKDNLGRPLTKLYLTIIKNNAGYKEWYGYDANTWDTKSITGSTVEFSHCFGKITCGFEVSEEATVDASINSINTITIDDGYDVSLINGDRVYDKSKDKDNQKYSITQNEVSYKHDNNFYGDLCCYDYFNAIETSIQPILHRFNTAQRESFSSESKEYFDYFQYDEIKGDDFDANDEFEISVKSKGGCGYKPEGYYYNPHYEIPIKEFGKLQYIMPDLLDIRSITSVSGNVKRIHTLQKHYLTPGDKALIYNVDSNRYYYLTAVRDNNSNSNVFYCTVSDEKGNEAASQILDLNSTIDDVSVYNLFKLDNLEIPSYATLLKDGSCRYIWRDVVNNGEEGWNETIEEYPFTNGAFYVNKRVDLYVRRQDPYSLYGLYSEDDILGDDIFIENENNYIEEEDIKC